MYNNRSCPHTPAPRKAGPRFPMSAAILETPSIMSSFRELEQPNGAANASHPPAPKQFIMSYSSNAPNGRNGCVEKATVNQQRHDLNATQSLNGSFLDCSFSSSFTTSMTTQNRKVPLANSSTNNLKTNTTLKMVVLIKTNSGITKLASFECIFRWRFKRHLSFLHRNHVRA
uniref:Uncharacterized protein n=1 Tax=Anopheles coluzzii TaxID=1518534 RepID=A0A6E8WBY2_ANOCL